MKFNVSNLVVIKLLQIKKQVSRDKFIKQDRTISLFTESL